jgi:hypothetical protein
MAPDLPDSTHQHLAKSYISMSKDKGFKGFRAFKVVINEALSLA